ncbi:MULTISPECIES: signal peptide peptidase SppA [Geobacter]|uniref:Multidrug transporter n=2 Tax=Geobacter TaxID=28231 RepID=A0A0C1QPX7_9BACT|nr:MULTISPECIES: signal peptide peptidase SppA [Geobacter]ANA40669.1 multidrug transporter [Geobacter anodireducens]KIE42732.1 multidrug transporter [Geobacter soli]MBE2888303.1 signal peptide peptidase SppA [Geobacter anodireducens]HMN03355.1 signal peptide peptidase SppA [Geobacter anodireducens]
MTRKHVLITGVTLVALIILFTFSVQVARILMGDMTAATIGDGVGYAEVKGPIIDSQETVKQLDDLRKKSSVKAVVLRVESPGGVIGPSQEIYAAVKRLAATKKVVVSMGSVAASGGYHVAVPAAVIYANPGTITGSIGVLMKLSNIEGLMDKVGLKAFTLKSGKFKDSGSPVRKLTEEERAVLQGVIDNLHDQFVRAVAEGRKLPVEEVRRLADGRVYTGEQALRLKLVDRLGTLHDAVMEAGRLAGIEGEPTLIIPPKKRKLLRDMLFGEVAEAVRGSVRKGEGLSFSYELE